MRHDGGASSQNGWRPALPEEAGTARGAFIEEESPVTSAIRTFAIALVAIATLGIAAGHASAQMSPEELLLQLDGQESAHSRKYIADRELGFATPAVSDAWTPDTLLATVLEFATEAEATSAFDTAMNGRRRE